MQKILILLVFGLTIFFAVSNQTTEEQTKLVVQSVVTDGVGEKAGILPGDILLKYNGAALNTLKQLNEIKAEVKTESVEIVIVRDDKEISFEIPKGPIGVYLKELLPDLKYKNDAVVIKDIPKLDWATGKMNSFLACVELVANHMGIQKDYTWLDGISGAAFRLHFCQGWCPSSPDPTCGYNSGEAALKALGLQYKVMHLSSDGKNRPEIKKAIKASINKKIPVIAIDLIDVAEWGLVTGYQDNGEELICRTFFDKRNSYDIAQKFPWALYIITGKKAMAKETDLYKQSYKTVLANLTTENYDQYFSGINAFDKWIEHLQKTDFAKMDSAQLDNAIMANSWIFDRLISDRADAAAYLESIAPKFPVFSSQLTDLANIYREESKMLEETEVNIPNSNIVKSSNEWTPAMRQDEVTLLQQAKTKEESALKIWQEIVKEK